MNCSAILIFLCSATLIVASSLESPFQDGCTIRITGDLGEPQPLIIDPAIEDILYPTFDNLGILELNSGQQIDLFCSQSFASSEFQNTRRLRATCYTGTNFLVDDHIKTFNQFSCTDFPIHEARRTGESCGNPNGILIKVGFDIGSRFIDFMDLCHDEVLEATLYSHIPFSALNFRFQAGFPRPPFTSEGFFGGKNVNGLYTNNNQVNTLTRILGSRERALEFIQPVETNRFLARGHVTAKVEVIYGSQQRGTFWFMNAAPQFQLFNAGNWESVESSTRRFYRDRNIRNGEIYTGTYGIMTLPDINNVQQQIFLTFDQNNNGQIPAPELFYKILLDKNTRRGIAIIGLNNIYLAQNEVSNYIYCNDISPSINWITWQRTNTTLGYMYACTVDEWAQVVGHLPPLDVSGGLLI